MPDETGPEHTPSPITSTTLYVDAGELDSYQKSAAVLRQQRGNATILEIRPIEREEDKKFPLILTGTIHDSSELARVANFVNARRTRAQQQGIRDAIGIKEVVKTALHDALTEVKF